MKIKNILLALLLLPALLQAAPIDPQTAQSVAEHFMAGKLPKPAALIRVNTKPVLGENPLYYVFNAADQTAFVIVAADDRFEPVLAYSTESTFSLEHMGVNTEAWFQDVEDEMQFGLDADVQPSADISSRWAAFRQGPVASDRSPSVGPLLQSSWGQESPYNAMCPLNNGKRTLVGCVATAMAQIMRFWKYPAQGNGSYSYSQSPYGTISANFGATTYNWNAMPLSNSSNSSNTELARANFHCGVAVKMNYSLTFSGAFIIKAEVPSGQPCAEKALVDYFRYDPSAVGRKRSSYATSTWENMLRTEINAGRPVLYGGQSPSQGGHAFVCDGYSESYFHFNWGWNGQHNNGYYLLSTMNPGGGVGFVNGQVAIFSLKPMAIQGCGTPSNLNATNITTSSATVNWNAVSGATQYYVQAKPSTSGSWTISGYVTSTGANLTGLSANTTYQWQVRAVCGASPGNFSVTATFNTSGSSGNGPSNDQICNAVNLTPSSSCSNTNGTNVGATPSYSGSTCNTSAPKDVWFKCLIPSSGYVTFRTTAGTLTDAMMAVYYGTCSSPTYITCEDDNYNGNPMPVIGITGQPGTQLWIRVWGYGNATGTFRICALNYNSADFGGEGQLTAISAQPDSEALAIDQPAVGGLEPLETKPKGKGNHFPGNTYAAGADVNNALLISPNPATEEATLRYVLAQDARIQVSVYDAIGRVVYASAPQQRPAGEQLETIDVAAWGNGLYTVRMLLGDEVKACKMQVLH